MKKISVIVPMYNSFRRMKKNLEVLSAQKDAEIELILVDDCSTDDSYAQALDYAAGSSFPFILIKNEKNSGPGVSRNNGLIHATGDYLIFVDSDDYFSENFTKELAPLLEKDIDCVVFDYVKADETGKILSAGSSVGCQRLSTGFLDVRTALVYTYGSTMCKIYKKEVIEKSGARFGEYYRNEDMPFTKHAIAFSGSVYYLPVPLYHYVQHSASLMHDASLCDEKDSERSFSLLSARLAGRGYDEELKAMELREILNNTVLIKIEKKEPRREIVRYIRTHYSKEHLKNKYFGDLSRREKIISRCAYHRNILALSIILKYKHHVKNKETKCHESN